jgi:hypothetical protein
MVPKLLFHNVIEITHLILHVKEANAIAHALGKKTVFELKLVATSFAGVKGYRPHLGMLYLQLTNLRRIL